MLLPPALGEAGRRLHPQRRVRVFRVVGGEPVGEDDLRLGQGVEQLDVEHLVAGAAVEGLDVGVLPERARRPPRDPLEQLTGIDFKDGSELDDPCRREAGECLARSSRQLCGTKRP